MFKRIRQLKISLAAKCQLLFGVAVVLIIAAALSVPWQRMEDLTRQVDEQAARTLARNAKLEHIARPYARPAVPESATDAAAEEKPSSSDPDSTPAPLRFLAIANNADGRSLTSFERRAL